MGDEENLMMVLDKVLENVPADRREIMKKWAHREFLSKPIITRVSKRLWINAYKDDKNATVPAGWHSVTWEAGKASPSNGDVLIFAMIAVDEGVQVYSFGQAAVEGSDQVGIVYFHETVHKPDVVFGPVTGDGLFEDFARYFATEEELDGLPGEPGDRPHANGAAS